VLVDLAEKTVHECDDFVRALRRETPYIMDQPRDMIAVAVSERAHRGNSAAVVFVGDVPVRGHVGADAIDHFELFGVWKVNLFPRMRDHLVRQDNDRSTVFLGQIEGFQGDAEAVLSGGDGKNDDGMIPVSPPARLHQVSLTHVGRQPRARSTPHDIHNHARNFGCACETQILLHQRKAGAAGGRHRLGTGERRPDNRSEARDLILHLDECAAHGRQPVRHRLTDFRRGSNGITGKKSATGGQCPLHDGFVAL